MHSHLQRKKGGGPADKEKEAPAARAQRAPAAGSSGRLGGTYGMGPAVKLGGAVQAKLTVGRTGDRFEREADQVAERVTTGGTAGEVSRIPAGGLAAQRRGEEGGNEEAQAEDQAGEEKTAQTKCAACEAEEKGQRQEDEGGEKTAQAATAGKEEEKVQRQEEDTAEEGAAQPKCAACEAKEKEKAQRQEEGAFGEGEAQPKCAACEAKEKAQRQEDDEGGAAQAPMGAEEAGEAQSKKEEPVQRQAEEPEPAQAAARDEGDVQRQADGASGAGGVDDVEEEGEESTGAAAAGVEGAEDAEMRECAPGEEGGQDRDEDEAAEGAGDQMEARDDLGCGEGGEGEGAEAAPGQGGQSCGAAVEAAGEEGEGAEGGAPAAEGSSPEAEEAPPPAGSAPACGDGVEAAEETPGEDAAAGAGPAPAGGAAPGGACATAQRQAESGAASEEETPAQGRDDGGEEERAAQTQDDESEMPSAQRAEEDDGTVQAKAEEPEAATAQTRREGAAHGKLDTATASRLIHARGAGEPLAPTVRGRLEGGLGVDLQDVRVHADGNAQAASRALRAKAFAHSNHIFLGPGQSQQDLGLMAHETAHVLQQGGVVRRKPANDAEPRQREAPAPAAAPAETTAAPAATTAGPAATTAGPAVTTAEPAATTAAPAATTAEPAVTTAGPAVTTAGPAVTTAGPAATTAGPAATTAGPAVATAAPAEPAEAPGAKPAGAPEAAGGPAAAAATKDAKEAKGKEGRPEGAGAPGRGGVAGGPAAGAPGEPAAGGPAAAGEGPAVPHSGAAAAAAARQADDRRRMTTVKGRLGREAVRQKGPAATRPKQAKTSSAAATAASAAAPTPVPEEPISRGEAVHTGKLEATETERGKVQPKTFLQLVDEKLAKLETPKTMEAMDDFKGKEGAKDLKEEVAGGVGTEVVKADGKIRGTLKDGPKPEPERVPTPLDPVPKTPHSARLGAPETAPAPRAEEEVSLEPSREKIEADLAENRLTKERLEKANDPRFTAVQKSREEVHEHADRAPAQLRREEAGTLATGRRELKGAEALAGAGMRGAHGAKQGSARGHQTDAMDKEAKERARIAGEIEKRYKKVEDDVRGKLEWLAGKDGEEGEVDRLFNEGEKKAREEFEGHVDREIKAWKRRRYGGRAAIPLIGGFIAAGTWAYDKLAGIDNKVQKYFDAGRAKYIAGLRATIESIAATVETALGWCNTQIAEGKKSIKNYIDTELPASQRTFARETAKSVSDRFDELREEVDATREELADRLVERYKESEQAIDDRIKEMQAENRGLVERFIEKLKEIIEAIRNFKNKIGPILSEAGDVMDEIIDDPIGFLGNLLGAIGRGFSQFKEHIEDHLKKGVIAWLFGTLGSDVQIPKEFSAAAIGGLALDLLGLSFDKLKSRAARMVGPRAMGVVDKVVDYLGTLYREGPAGLWRLLEEDVGNLKDEILEEVKSWVITRIITAAVKKLAMMFNPVGAIIQAVLTIYNVVMFFIENIDRILELVRTVVRAAADVVRGKIQAAADKIETALGMTIPLILAFLARLVGLSGVAEKVRSVIMRFKTKVEKAVTKFLRKLVAKFKAGARKVAAKGKAVAAKIFEWWKLKKRFKQGAESHTLFFTGAAGAAELMIASNQRPLVEFLTERKKTATEAEKKVIKQIEVKTLAVDKLKTTTRDGKTEAAYIGKERGEAIRKLFEAIAALLAQLPGATTTARPKTVVKWKQRGDEGKSMVAKPLSIDPGEHAGSAPSEESILWQAVKVRSGAYVRGHLLNHHVHGPGVKKNLVTVPGGDNTRMQTSFESTVKKAVLQDNKVISYSVAAVHGKQPPRTFVPEERSIPTKLSLSAHVLNPNKKAKSDPVAAQKPGNWTKGAVLFDEPSFDLTLPPDTPVGFKPQPSRINLNSPRDARFDRGGAGSSVELVKEALAAHLPGIGEERASIILGNAPYRSFEQLATLTDGAGHTFVTTDVIDRLRSTQAAAGGRLFNLGGDTEIQTKP